MAFTRRHFSQALAGAAVWQSARPASAQSGAQSGAKIGYCIIALGRISMQHFMPGIAMTRNCRLTGIVSGHRDKAEKMAAQFNIPTTSIYDYQNMDRIADNKDIDAVYVALPNSMHAEFTIRSAKAGKHVLCEKPMATSVADSEAMIAACKQGNRKLMIAYRCQYEPVNLRAVEIIRSGKLGKIQSVQSSNGFNIAPNEWRCNGKLAGGGPLMDMGIYSLNACRYLIGEEPTGIFANAHADAADPRFKEVEEALAWTMKFPSGALADCVTTYGANMPGYFRVYGSNGILHCDSAFGYQGQHLTAQIRGEPLIDMPSTAKDPSQFPPQADHFAECIMQNKEPKSDGEEGLRDMKLMHEIYRAAGRA